MYLREGVDLKKKKKKKTTDVSIDAEVSLLLTSVTLAQVHIVSTLQGV